MIANNKLNFGCGKDIREGWDNVDIQKSPDLFKSFDFNIFPYPLETNYYDYILINQVLGYLNNPKEVLEELYKFCKPKSIIHIEVPYYNNKGTFNDMEYLHYFSDATFRTFVDELTIIKKKNLFKIIKLELTPTIVGKIIGKWIRERLCLLFNGLISQIHVELEVIKKYRGVFMKVKIK